MRPRWMLAAVGVALGAAIALVSIRLVDGQSLLGFTVDDAYITFRYSGHLAHGHGPGWNLGAAGADGYTSPLWMLLIAIGDLLGVAPEHTAKALSLCALAAILAMLAFASRGRAAAVAVVAMAALALSPAFMTITVQGFETTAAAALAAATALLLLRAIRRPRRRELIALAVASLLTVLARPDLLPLVLCCLAGLGLWLFRRRDGAALRRAALWVFAGLVVPGLAWAAWRWSYYGYPLPNTAYVKRTSGVLSGESLHLVGSFFTRVAWPYAVAIALLLSVRRSRDRDPELTWAVCAVVAGVLANLAAGLRFEPIQGYLWRFQMPVLPVLALCVVLLASSSPPLPIRASAAARAAAAAAAFAAFGVALPLSTLHDVRREVRSRWTYDRERAGRALAPFPGAGRRMFVSESGALPWAAGWDAYDILGLTDHHVAVHGPAPAYVASLRPDLLQVVVSVEGRAHLFVTHPYTDLLRTGRYEFATATLKTTSALVPARPALGHFYFVRRDAPRAREIVAALRHIPRVRHVPAPITAQALRLYGLPIR